MWLRISLTLRRLPPWQLVFLALFAVIIVLTVVGPDLAPYSTIEALPTDRLIPPSAAHWFGTDDNGIDILSRLLAAPRTDVVIAVIATAISVLLGSPLGVVIALFESRRGAGSTIVAEIAMRSLEVIQAFPVFVFAMVLVAAFGGTKVNIIAAIAFVNTPVFVRLVRSEVLSLVQRPFAEAARAVGNSEWRVGFRHILPNAIPTILVQLSVTIGFAILLTAGLSFVGAGVKPPTPELGSMIASGAKFLIIGQWWPALFPGIALGLVVFSFGVFGEVMTKIMEPRAIRPATWRASKTHDRPDNSSAVSNFTTAANAILTVRDLDVTPLRRGAPPLLSGVSFSLGAGERMAIVGESGAGKSILVKAVLGLLPAQLQITSGQVRYGEVDLLTLDKSTLRSLRCKHIAATLANAKSQLHPLMTVGRTFASALAAHQKVTASEARRRSIELLRMVGMNDPERRLEAYPHELSGGMAQRVCLALALMYRPRLLIADEPTAGLDVTVQRQVLDLMEKLASETGTAQLIVTADLGIAAQYCDKVAVMQAGRVVEINDTRAFFDAPAHPYSKHLLDSVRL
jgi:ABC-type dipeptide/oligopeptide/nickel transport system ATPase component/ABC-type dipeptide/oligopeptide/nickel transport system permease subunit